jgi:uncharacterized protein YjiS (DUF1127 family)
MLVGIALWISQWRRNRATQRALESLDARSLKDIGLYRRMTSLDHEPAMLRTLGLR